MSTSKDSGAAFLFIMRLMVDTHMKNMDYKKHGLQGHTSNNSKLRKRNHSFDLLMQTVSLMVDDLTQEISLTTFCPSF